MIVEPPLLEEPDEEPIELEVEGMVVLLETGNELREEELDCDWEGAPVDVLTDVEVTTPIGPIARNAAATRPTTITTAIAAVASREIAARLFAHLGNIALQ